MNETSDPRTGQSGFTLVTSLILMSALVFLAISVFAMARIDSAVSRVNYNSARGDLAVDQLAIPQVRFEEEIFAHSRDTDDFIVFRSEDPAGSDYFYTARLINGNWEYKPLFSGGKTISGGGQLSKIELNGSQRLIDGVEVITLDNNDSIKASDVVRIPEQFGNPTIGWEVFRPDPESLPEDSSLDDIELRYAYWIEDLGGRLDGEVSGNSRGGNQHIRKYGKTPADLALFTLISDDGKFPASDEEDEDSASSKMDADNYLIKLRASETAGLSEDFVLSLLKEQVRKLGSGDPPLDGFEDTSRREWQSAIDSVKDEISFGIPDWSAEASTSREADDPDSEDEFRSISEFIPSRNWIASDEHGRGKLALNPLIAKAEQSLEERDEVIRAIAEHIRNCYPNFASRRAGGNLGGATGYDRLPITEDEYLHSLAANIVDYADRDLTPSVGWNPEDAVPENQQFWSAGRVSETPGGRTYDSGDLAVPLYRGIDGQPFVLGLTNRLHYKEWGSSPAPWVKVYVSTWISIWNPFEFEIEGSVAARLTEGWTQVKWGMDRPVLPHLNLPPQNVILLPNQFTHVRWQEHTVLESTGTGDVAPRSILMDDRSFKLFEAGFQLFWRDSENESDKLFLADRTRYPDCLNRDYRRNVGQGRWWYFSSGIGDSEHLRFPDPRGTLYTPGAVVRAGRRYWRSAFFDRLCLWGGGATRSTYGDRLNYGSWGDHNHVIPGNQFNAAPDRNSFPEAAPPPPSTPDPAKAPFKVRHPIYDYPADYSGPGYYESLGELGNVYDPGCWSQSKSGTVSATHYSAGRTLRIGSEELATFDDPGVRAADLLDIFCLEIDKEQKGLVNVNTASREVLRTLVAGMDLEADPGMEKNGDGELRAPTDARPGDLVADAIIDGRPYSSPKGVLLKPTLATSPNEPFFGNLAAWSGSDVEPVALDDAGREELASRFIELTTTRSRAFRIYLTAHVVDLFRARGSDEITNERVVSRRSRIYNVFLRPVVEDGQIVDQEIEVYYEKDL